MDWEGVVLPCLMQYFSYIVVVSFDVGGNRSVTECESEICL